MRLVAFAVGLALMSAVVPGWSGMATTPRWVVGAGIAFALFCAPARRTTAAHCLGLALIGWMIVSLAWSASAIDGADQAAKLIVVAAAFAWGATLTDLRPLVAGAAIGIALSSLVALAQWFGWTGIETSSTGTPAGLFYNHNRAAEAAALVLAASIALRMWWALPGLVPSLILPQDRTAWLAVAVVVGIVVWQRLRGFDRFVLATIAVMLVALAAMTAEIWRTANFGTAAIAERIAMWSFVADHFTPLGHGLGSFTHDGPLLAAPSILGSPVVSVTKAEHPHNEFLWLAYEGGLPALGLFGAFAVLWWRSCAGADRLVVVALGIISCFAMPLHDPATALFGAVCAGHAVGHRDRVRAAADAGRDPLRAWVEQERGRGAESGGVAAGGGALPVRAAVS